MTPHFQRLGLSIWLAAAGSLAHAGVLLTESVTNSVDVVDTPFGGTLLGTAVTHIRNPSYNGVARTAVYESTLGLDFYYQFSNDATSVNGIERFTAYDFRSLGIHTPVNIFQTSAAFDIFEAGTEAADHADRSKLGVIGFNFVPNGTSYVNPGSNSYTMIIRTDAHEFSGGHFGLLDGIGDNAVGFAPAATVPEPSSSSLTLAGLALLMVGWRKLNRT